MKFETSLWNTVLLKRSALFIQGAVDEGYIKEQDVDYIGQTLPLLIWKGMMNTVINKRRNYTRKKRLRKHFIMFIKVY